MSTIEQRQARRRADIALAALDRVADRVVLDEAAGQHDILYDWLPDGSRPTSTAQVHALWNDAVLMERGALKDRLLVSHGMVLARMGGIRFVRVDGHGLKLAMVLTVVAIAVPALVVGFVIGWTVAA